METRRSHRRRRTAVVAAILTACTVTPAARAADDPAQRKAAVDRQLGQVASQLQSDDESVGAATAALEQLNTRLAAAQSAVVAANTDVARATAALAAAEQDLARARAASAAAAKRVQEAEQQVADRRAVLQEALGSAYQNITDVRLQALLAGSLPDYLDRESLLSVSVDDADDAIHQLEVALAAAAAERDRLVAAENASRDAQERAANALSQQQAALAYATQSRNAVAALQAQQVVLLRQAQAERAADQANYAQLQAESARLAQILAHPPVPVTRGAGRPRAGGQIAWPVNAPITSPFGWRMHPILHIMRFHSGVDFGVAYGTPVHVARGGRVAVAGPSSGYGNFVCIDAGGGFATCYAHLSQIDVSIGQYVGTGAVLGLSGNSGLSTGPHLHFEVRINGTPVDPMPYL